MKKILCFAALTVTTLLSSPAFSAQKDMGIAATVGSDAITSYDLENRIRFIVATSGFSGNPDSIRPEVMRSLINEKLEIQEAHKNGLSVSEDDVLQAVHGIEAQRGMPQGTIFQLLDAKGVPKDTFAQQIQAQILWHNLLMAKIRPTVHVSEAEIDLAVKRVASEMSAPAPQQEKAAPSSDYKIAVITLPVDKPSREGEIKKFGEKLVAEIKHGANFEEMARQFSSDAATNGGKVEAFWIKPAQLDPKVARSLAGARTGAITNPVRTEAGFTIIKVYDVRTPVNKAPKTEAPAKPKDQDVYLKEILLKAKPDTGDKEADAMLQIGEEVAKNPGTCEEKGVASIKNIEESDLEVGFAHHNLSELPAGVRTIVSGLKIGEISTPFASYEGIRLYMLCDKKEVDAKPIDRDAVGNMVFQQKMQLESQKYLRDLRREAFVDVR